MISFGGVGGGGGDEEGTFTALKITTRNTNKLSSSQQTNNIDTASRAIRENVGDEHSS